MEGMADFRNEIERSDSRHHPDRIRGSNINIFSSYFFKFL